MASAGLTPVMYVDVDDITEWIDGGKIRIFNESIAALRRAGQLRSTDISEYALHIAKKFKNSKSQVKDQLKWLAILFNQDTKVQREFLDSLILLCKNRASDHPPTREKALLAEVLFSSIVADTPALLKIRHPITQRSLFHEAAVRGAHEVLVLCNEQILRSNPVGGRAIVSDLILARDQSGQTALSLAISSGNDKTITMLLSLCNINDEDTTVPDLLLAGISKLCSLAIIQTLLRRTTTSESSTASTIPSRVGLSVRSGEYRTHWITQEMVGVAVANNRRDIVEFLVTIRPECVHRDSCTLLHDAVERDLAEIAIFLIEICPAMTVRKRSCRVADPSVPLAAVLREQSALALIRKDTRNGQLIKARMMPVMMQQLPVSEIRQHFHGGEWNEIYLDLNYLRIQPAYLDDFLSSIQNDLDQAKQRLQDDVVQPNMTPKTWRSNYDVEFESALKYAEIPLMSDESAGPGQGAATVLDWLKTCKKVQSIYELRIKDSLRYPHSEEKVERALQDLDVRELDWRRTDLSIFAIKSPAPDVKRLTLYSNGNLGALDHWLGPHGISALDKLRHVTFVIATDDLTTERIEICENLIREELALRPNYHEGKVLPQHQAPPDTILWNVRIEPWNTPQSDTPGITANSPETPSSKSAPVSVAGLSHFLQAYRYFQDEVASHWPNSKTKVKVAILDTGVNRGIFPKKQHNIYGASFCHRDPGPRERESPWWLATDPHGSYVANIISQLDPSCNIYVAQIAIHKDHIPAFEWAISQGVQIINCSFVLFKKHPELEAQINAAADKGILIMCSTADEGYIRQDVWPAKYSSSDFANVIPIAACDFKGKLTGYSSATLARYRLQGEQIDASHPDASLKDEVTQGIVSGSSVATAMATGIASLILACESMVRIIEKVKVSRTAVQVVANTFRKMNTGDGKDTGPMFIYPSKFFPTEKDYFADNEDFKDWILRFGKGCITLT